MNITFIGNCQTVALCFYFQQLLNNNHYSINWVLPYKSFRRHLKKWSEKCKNKYISDDKCIETIKNSDIIIYQNISLDTSKFCNTNTLEKISKRSCKLICIPCAYLIYEDFDNSIINLIERENKNNVDITVSDIFFKFRNKNLMLTVIHLILIFFLRNNMWNF
jgi:hypothetical protein